MTDSGSIKTLRTKAGPWAFLAGGMMVSLVYLLFVAFWWNRYDSPISGWFEYGGQLMGQGKIPYRDFYLFIPPFHLFEMCAIQRLFGDEFWIVRIPGILQRLAISLTVMAWLARQYPIQVVVPAVIAGLMVSETCVYMGFFSYYYSCFLYAVLMGFAAHLAQEKPFGRSYLAWALLAGVFGGLSSLTKQTVGPFTTAVTCAVLGLILWRRAGWRPAVKVMVSLSVGFWIPVGLTLAWLAHHGALGGFVEQVFLVGPSSKGSLRSILIRPAVVMGKWLDDGISYPLYPLFHPRKAALLMLGVAAFAINSRFRILPTQSLVRLSRVGTMAVTILCLAAILIASRVAFNYTIDKNPDLMYFQFSPSGPPSMAKFVICRIAFASVYFSLGGLVLSTYRFWRDPSRTDHASRVLLYAVCLAVYYSSSISMGAQGYEPIGYTAVSAMMACLLSLDFRFLPRLSRGAVASLAIIACFGVTCIKLNCPLCWVGWTENPTNESVFRSRQPLLRNLLLQSETIGCLDKIAEIIERHSKPGEPIFVYPFMPVFYSLTDRHPMTFAYIHYYDVCADKFVREDTRRLLDHPPAVIVMMDFAQQSVDFHEKTFRAGTASAQSEMRFALAKLTSEYELVATFDGKSHSFGDMTSYPIKVWARPGSDRLAASGENKGR